jgi:type IV secretion system protein TrbF
VFKKSKNPQILPLSGSADAPVGMYDDAKDQFAEIYAGSRVASARMFVVAAISGLVSIASVGGVVLLSRNNVAEPWIVEVNKDSGVVDRPVRVVSMRPSDAVIKAELAKWVVKVFTIDAIQTPQLMREANQLTRGLGTSQFAEFRLQQKVLERMTQDPSLQRKVNIASVDASQNGLAFVFLSTQEAQGTAASTATASWRVTLKYELSPPKTEQEILANPLGLFVTSMNVTQEGAPK